MDWLKHIYALFDDSISGTFLPGDYRQANKATTVLDTGLPPTNSTLGEVVKGDQSIALAFRLEKSSQHFGASNDPIKFHFLRAALMTKHVLPGSVLLWQICPETTKPNEQGVPNTTSCIASDFFPVPPQSATRSFVWATWKPANVVEIKANQTYWVVLSSDAKRDEDALIWIDSDKGSDPWGTAFSNEDNKWIRDRDGSLSVPSIRILLH
ncbi:hypothetical protein INT43_006278 [Umbelopsis isabellina]|uniref:Uncharacterized protein n=1 Tax=Mortierella isabellina TaxID=91625 RepID=A0A8H7Q1D6_MORIS|nr:hypothetical protein INT43_006278 [Umbelopsis isabellina]